MNLDQAGSDSFGSSKIILSTPHTWGLFGHITGWLGGKNQAQNQSYNLLVCIEFKPEEGPSGQENGGGHAGGFSSTCALWINPSGSDCCCGYLPQWCSEDTQDEPAAQTTWTVEWWKFTFPAWQHTNSLYVKKCGDFLACSDTLVSLHPSYSPDLSPCDFCVPK